MIAVEADLEDVKKLLSQTSKRNPEHPGPSMAPEALPGLVPSQCSNFKRHNGPWPSTIKAKILDVTNAFHSTLVESLMSDLETVGHGLFFKAPTLPMEKATTF